MMFKPLKGLLAIFGGNNSSKAEAEEGNDILSRDSDHVNQVNGVERSKMSEDNAVLNENQNESPNGPDSDGIAVSLQDDIESQIKSNIMLRPTLLNQSLVNNNNNNNNHSSNKNHDPDKGHAQQPHEYHPPKVAMIPPDEDDELADFQYDPLQGAAAEDYCSAGSEMEAEVTDNDSQARDDDEEDLLREPLAELDRIRPDFPESEIVVVADSDLNSTVVSDPLSEDPLSFDDNFAVLQGECDEKRSASATSINSSETSINEDRRLQQSTTPPKKFTTVIPTPIKLAANAVEPIAIAVHRQNLNEEQTNEELRDGGSDSGLGSETSALQSTINSLIDTSQSGNDVCDVSSRVTPLSTPNNKTNTLVHCVIVEKESSITKESSDPPQPNKSLVPVVIDAPKPLRSSLKRRIAELTTDDDDILRRSDAEKNSTAVVAATSAVRLTSADGVQKKAKRSINFNTVQIYYFPRQQGFGCVPSAGGCTLGMSAKHVSTRSMTLAEHAAEIRRAHRLQLQEINPRGSSSEDSDESEEDYLSEGSGSDLDTETSGSLQPLSPKQRRILLKAAGVRKIDASEKVECRIIRNSRDVCGCSCREFCYPDTCACSQAGIKCQVDRAMFPCGCSRDACGNTFGRIEFSPTRVRTHYIHTLMRLAMEKRQQHQPPGCLGDGFVNYNVSATSFYSMSVSNAHPPSNYSSGYASPAYSCDTVPAANFYQQQQSSSANQLAPCLYNREQQSGGLMTSQMHLQTPSHSYYNPLDQTDGNLYGSATANTADYAELPPSSCFSNTLTAIAYQTQSATNASYASNISQTYSSYSEVYSSGGIAAQYSSCALPSEPPYGSAATTTTAAQYLCAERMPPRFDTDEVAVGGNMEGTHAASYIDLNPPSASSSRLTQINDLLQSNRNTTAALRAVTSATAVSSTSSSAPATTCGELLLKSMTDNGALSDSLTGKAKSSLPCIGNYPSRSHSHDLANPIQGDPPPPPNDGNNKTDNANPMKPTSSSSTSSSELCT